MTNSNARHARPRPGKHRATRPRYGRIAGIVFAASFTLGMVGAQVGVIR
jgi:hypothetical protein